ncbi:MAG: hypothetical protein ACM3UZ_09715 [Acidobacteriota bacterium]
MDKNTWIDDYKETCIAQQLIKQLDPLTMKYFSKHIKRFNLTEDVSLFVPGPALGMIPHSKAEVYVNLRCPIDEDNINDISKTISSFIEETKKVEQKLDFDFMFIRKGSDRDWQYVLASNKQITQDTLYFSVLANQNNTSPSSIQYRIRKVSPSLLN